MDKFGHILTCMNERKEPTMQEECPTFAAAVKALGKTRRERAAKLQTSPKTIDRLLDRLPESMKPFRMQPHLLRALADDLDRLLHSTQDCPN
jgi:hypothetical protein